MFAVLLPPTGSLPRESYSVYKDYQGFSRYGRVGFVSGSVVLVSCSFVGKGCKEDT
jgi:hypothetical protein